MEGFIGKHLFPSAFALYTRGSYTVLVGQSCSLGELDMQPATIATPEGAYPGMIQDISEAKNLDEVIEMVPALGQEVVAAPASFVWDDELTDVPNHQVLVNKETGRPYAISSKKYGILQHRDALAICEGMTDYSFNQAGVLSDGGTVWVSMRTDSQVVKQYDGQDDEIVPGILALSDHTLTSADLVLNSCTRLFCNNQIPSVKRNHEARFSISHRSQIVERMKKAAEIARTSLCGYRFQSRQIPHVCGTVAYDPSGRVFAT